MSAYVIVEFMVKDPDVLSLRNTAPTLGRRPKSKEARLSPTVTGRSCTALARLLQGHSCGFPNETALLCYNSPEYQQLIEVRSVAMGARFSLLDSLPS